MASYDSPGGVSNPMPGLQGVDRAQTAPGTPSPGAMPDTDSAGTAPEAGTHGSSAFVVPFGGSLINGDRVDVSPLDTGVSSQADSYGASPDPLTGVGRELGDSGAGEGSVVTTPHPNSMNIGSLAAQTANARTPS